MREGIVIRPLRLEEVERAGAIAAAALSDDPMYCYIFPDPEVRARRLGSLLAASVRLALRAGEAFGAFAPEKAGEEMAGAALWLPGGRAVWPWKALFREWGFLLRTWFSMDLSAHVRSQRIMTALKQWRPRVRFHYLGGLFVSEAHRGKGFGTALLKDGLLRADRDGSYVYLETSSLTLRFYARAGFSLSRSFLLPGGSTCWSLLRPPGGTPPPPVPPGFRPLAEVFP